LPYIPKLEEDNVRQGFLEPEQYETLLEEFPQRLKALLVCAYHVGTRKGELRKIRWEQVDFDAGLIKLTARQTKGKAARSLSIYGEMERWLRKQLEDRIPECPLGLPLSGKASWVAAPGMAGSLHTRLCSRSALP
jgi:integrase